MPEEKPSSVLLVEDDREYAEVVTAMLECSDDATFTVESVDTLERGLNRLKRGGIELVLLDLSLPDSTGLETVRAVCTAAPGVAVVVLTGRDDQGLAMEALRIGAEDYLVKGQMDASTLSRAMLYALERQRGEELRERQSRLEIRVAERTEELSRANASLQAEIEERRRAEAALEKEKQAAETANRAKDQFLAVLSHELRTPLTPVLATLDALEKEAQLTPELQKALEMIRRNVSIEAGLIDDLLDVTRIGAGKVQLNRGIVDLHPLVHHVIKMMERDIDNAGLRVHLELNADISTVDGDYRKLHQILWNLLRNAVKFTPNGGHITVRTDNCRDSAAVRMQVSDDGVGIDPSVMPHIFQPFRQGEECSILRRYGGLGLGLAIAKGLSEAHGGTLEASSEGLDRGACFAVELATAEVRGVPHTTHVDSRPQQEKRHYRILLVDDHEDTRQALLRLLLRQGYEVDLAEGFHSGLAAARAESYDLLISDIGLSDGSGLDLMSELSVSKPLKGIALSGFGMESDVAQSMSAGFSEHLTKPIDFKKLDAAIQRIGAETATSVS